MRQPTEYRFCVQCKDLTTNTIGDFMYHKDRPFRAASPVFGSLTKLFLWMHERDMEAGPMPSFDVYRRNK